MKKLAIKKALKANADKALILLVPGTGTAQQYETLTGIEF